MTMPVDLDVDWNTQDESGLPWTFLDEAADPSKIVPGAFVVAGRAAPSPSPKSLTSARTGVVHLRDVGGSLEENLHLVRQPVA